MTDIQYEPTPREIDLLVVLDAAQARERQLVECLHAAKDYILTLRQIAYATNPDTNELAQIRARSQSPMWYGLATQAGIYQEEKDDGRHREPRAQAAIRCRWCICE